MLTELRLILGLLRLYLCGNKWLETLLRGCELGQLAESERLLGRCLELLAIELRVVLRVRLVLTSVWLFLVVGLLVVSLFRVKWLLLHLLNLWRRSDGSKLLLSIERRLESFGIRVLKCRLQPSVHKQRRNLRIRVQSTDCSLLHV